MNPNEHVHGPIVHTSPAQGWGAVYAHVEGGRLALITQPLISWAVIARVDSNTTMAAEIHGLLLDTEKEAVLCGHEKNFLGYLPPGADVEALYAKSALRYQETQRHRNGYEETKKRSA